MFCDNHLDSKNQNILYAVPKKDNPNQNNLFRDNAMCHKHLRGRFKTSGDLEWNIDKDILVQISNFKTTISFNINVSSDLLSIVDCIQPDVVGDGYCNDETNNPECNYDSGDCCGVCVNTGQVVSKRIEITPQLT